MGRTARRWYDFLDFKPRVRRQGKGRRYERKLKSRYYRFIQERGLVVPRRYISQAEIDRCLAQAPDTWMRALYVCNSNSTTCAIVYCIQEPGFYRVGQFDGSRYWTRYAAGYPDYHCWRASAPGAFAHHERERAEAWNEHWEVTETLRHKEAVRRAKRAFREYEAERKARIAHGRKFWGVFAAASGAAA